MIFEVRAFAAPWNRAINLLIRCGRMVAAFKGEEEEREGGGYCWRQPTEGSGLMFVPIQYGASPEPSIEISPQDAQTLMDDLWRAGLRPTEGAGSAGSLAATERHLQDMRRLVFDSERKGL